MSANVAYILLITEHVEAPWCSLVHSLAKAQKKSGGTATEGFYLSFLREAYLTLWDCGCHDLDLWVRSSGA